MMVSSDLDLNNSRLLLTPLARTEAGTGDRQEDRGGEQSRHLRGLLQHHHRLHRLQLRVGGHLEGNSVGWPEDLV